MESCLRAGLRVVLCTLAMLVPAVAVGAPQQTVNFASASGRVADASGAVIVDARIIAREIETNITTTAVADAQGRFRFPYLKPGPYEITALAPGFDEWRRRLTLTVGSSIELPITVHIAAVETNVNVSADQEVLETTRTEIAATVPHSEIQDLPLNGRNFIETALLIPGVSPTNTASNQLFAESSAVPGQGVSVNSQRNFSNSFIVDGLSANDDAAGLSGVFYGYDVIGETQVVTSGGQAEFGRALGGYMNVITKSGTNATHGDVYGYFRNQRLNAANALSHIALPVTQAQYGVSLGGPLLRNRTFYYGNFEQRELNQSGLITISPAIVSTINSRLLSVGYPGPLISTGIYPNPVHSTNILAKVDHQLSAADQASIRYSAYRVTSIHSRGAGGLSAVTASADLDNTDETIALGNVASLTNRLVNETRGQMTRSNLQAPPTDNIGPAVNISGVASFGTLSGSPTARLNNLYEVIDNLSYQNGRHSVRVGADFLYNHDTITFPRSIRGSYSFASLAAFLSGTYNNSGFTQTFSNSVVGQTNPNVGMYVQDEWKVGRHFTLNAGLRYDLQFLKTIITDTNNVAPRLGFAWTPSRSGSTVVRGSYGLFYDRVPLRALANSLLSAGNTTDVSRLSQISISLSPTQTGAPVFPAVLSSLTLPSGTLFNFSTMNPHMQNAYSEQGSLEIEQQLGHNNSISIGYQHVRGLHLIISVNQNVPTCVASGNNNGCRPNPNYGNNSQYSSLADSHYDGLHFSFMQRPARWGNYRVSYAYSKALDDVGEFFFSAPIDNSSIWKDYGRSDDDQRHRLVFDGTIHTSNDQPSNLGQRLTHGFQLSGLLQYYSALPLNVTTGANTVQGPAARPIINGQFIGRNSGIGFDLFNVNVRLARRFQTTEHFRVEGTLEAFNLLNHVNTAAVNGTFGTGTYPYDPLPTFKQITTVQDPRTLQVGLRLSF